MHQLCTLLGVLVASADISAGTEMRGAQRQAAALANPPYFRGTPNNWGKTPMVELFSKYGRTDWALVQEFAAGGEFKIAVGEDWSEAYPEQNYVVQQGAGRYQVRFTDWDLKVGARKLITFRCNNGNTEWGQSVYVVGNTAELGNWDPARARKLEPTSYPTWVGELPIGTQGNVEWKCLKRDELDASKGLVWQSGSNNVFDASGVTETSATF